MNASATQPVKNSPAIRHARLTKTARQMVGSTFFGTLLKQTRNSPFKSKLFSGGRGEQAFGALGDQYLAERLGTRSGKRLADSMVKRIEKRANAAGVKPVNIVRPALQRPSTIDTLG